MNPNFMPMGQMPQAQPMPHPGATPWGNAAAAPQAPAQSFGGFGNGVANGFNGSATRAPQLNPGDGAPISFNPATFTEGGMIDNVWVRFSNGRASTFDYKGKSSAGASPAVIYDLQIVDAQTHQPLPGAAPQEKVWTVGKLEDFQPRANGVQFWSPSGKTGFNKSSNWAVFIRAAVQAGIPADVFNSGQVDALNGMVAFVQQVKTGGRESMRNTGAGEKADGGTLVVTQIPGGARVAAETLGAVGGGAGGGAVAQPLAQAPQAMAPAPAMMAPVMAQPMAQAPAAPMMQFAPPQAQAQAPAPAAPAGPTVDVAAAQRLLAEVLQTNPTSKQAFNVALFQRTLTDEPLRNLVASPEFQRQMLGTALNLA